MCQVSGVDMYTKLKGKKVKKGDEFGKFRFGGSDRTQFRGLQVLFKDIWASQPHLTPVIQQPAIVPDSTDAQIVLRCLQAVDLPADVARIVLQYLSGEGKSPTPTRHMRIPYLLQGSSSTLFSLNKLFLCLYPQTHFFVYAMDYHEALWLSQYGNFTVSIDGYFRDTPGHYSGCGPLVSLLKNQNFVYTAYTQAVYPSS
jgi:hypothetical protein